MKHGTDRSTVIVSAPSLSPYSAPPHRIGTAQVFRVRAQDLASAPAIAVGPSIGQSLLLPVLPVAVPARLVVVPALPVAVPGQLTPLERGSARPGG